VSGISDLVHLSPQWQFIQFIGWGHTPWMDYSMPVQQLLLRDASLRSYNRFGLLIESRQRHQHLLDLFHFRDSTRFPELANQASYAVTAFLTNTFSTVGTNWLLPSCHKEGEPCGDNVAQELMAGPLHVHHLLASPIHNPFSLNIIHRDINRVL
jgi:hypothetical protein